MIRTTIVVMALIGVVGCSDGNPEGATGIVPETFIGTWRSTNQSFEFVRLTIVSKSVEEGALGARLTFSGVAWDGKGVVSGDSLLLDLTVSGTNASRRIILVHEQETNALRLTEPPGTADGLNLTLVRERSTVGARAH